MKSKRNKGWRGAPSPLLVTYNCCCLCVISISRYLFLLLLINVGKFHFCLIFVSLDEDAELTEGDYNEEDEMADSNKGENWEKRKIKNSSLIKFKVIYWEHGSGGQLWRLKGTPYRVYICLADICLRQDLFISNWLCRMKFIHLSLFLTEDGGSWLFSLLIVQNMITTGSKRRMSRSTLSSIKQTVIAALLLLF